MKLLRAGKRADHSHIVSHVKEEVTEEHEKVECNTNVIQLNPANPGGGGGGAVYSGFQVTGMLEGFFWVRKFGFRVGKFLASTFLGSLI